ncbi:nuclease-related domain-containing protein [Aliamphritea ceti]|uniref:nuclease-related domain-containing protein n=1 Tax=Aliamphritea ceti TaxID=1524258 RepID=UPI0021C3C03F|nr:nuclease-related domain-containing protein [Aliamphritea ceti]
MYDITLPDSHKRGKRGERLVHNSLTKYMNSKGYHNHLLQDVTLEVDGKTTQIDHSLISLIGIFVIETKNMDGWIFGNAKSKAWTQSIYGKKHKFMNPIHQNYKHLVFLNKIFDAPQRLNSLVIFTDAS